MPGSSSSTASNLSSAARYSCVAVGRASTSSARMHSARPQLTSARLDQPSSSSTRLNISPARVSSDNASPRSAERAEPCMLASWALVGGGPAVRDSRYACLSSPCARSALPRLPSARVSAPASSTARLNAASAPCSRMSAAPQSSPLRISSLPSLSSRSPSPITSCSPSPVRSRRAGGAGLAAASCCAAGASDGAAGCESYTGWVGPASCADTSVAGPGCAYWLASCSGMLLVMAVAGWGSAGEVCTARSAGSGSG
mmetsp:Transcript_25620/g.65020  ORF Transcript_25620/g.65020 Transcript_25620/m.65020 type:complete len:256 (+) Transcript_25620:518-1285(+)